MLLTGASTGSIASGAALENLKGEARSPMPTLGLQDVFIVFANLLLTVAESVILLLWGALGSFHRS